jgi:3-hydroxyisobutyrate dehydrogenase
MPANALDPARDTIGFLGLGVMGSSMAGHVMGAGFRVRVNTRTRGKAEALLARGAEWADGPASLARSCSAVVTMVGYPSDVEEVYFGPGGLVENAGLGTILIDCTTSKPDLAARISKGAAAKGVAALDAPVSGGDIGARNATLTIMVGGDPEAFEAARPVLDAMGKTVVLQGPSGSGQHAKMANQISIAGALMGAVESMIYAKGAGLDPSTVLRSIGSGSAGSWQLNNMVPRMLDGDFAPGFYVKHFLKDLRIALDSARAMKLDLPLLSLAENLFWSLMKEGSGEKGTQALYLLYETRRREGP